MRALDGDRAGAFGGIPWRVHTPPTLERALDEARGLLHRLFSNLLDAHFDDDLQSRLASIQRGNVRRAVEETVGILAHIHWADLEIEWTLMREPAREGRR